MPNLTGLTLAEEVLKLRPLLPIIIYAGYNAFTSRDKAKEIGIRKFLRKPIDNRTMAAHICKILDKERAPIGNARAEKQ